MIRGVIENQAHLFFNEPPPDFYTLIPAVAERTDLFFLGGEFGVTDIQKLIHSTSEKSEGAEIR